MVEPLARNPAKVEHLSSRTCLAEGSPFRGAGKNHSYSNSTLTTAASIISQTIPNICCAWVGENGMGCYVMMWLCDLVNWKMMPCELQKTYVTARPLRRKFRCACDPGVINRNKPGKNPRHNSVLQDISPYSKQKGHYSVLQNSTAYQSSLQSSKYASLFEASTKWHSVPQGTTAYHSTLHELPLRTTK